MQKNRVIQLELNEISIAVIQKLIREKNCLPHFKFILDNWHYKETTSESQYENIEPWIQWVTVHTGKTFAEHNLFRLGDASALSYPQVWETLSTQGLESAIIGSMNCTRGNTQGGVFFPDPWAKENSTYPENLRPLWALIAAKVQGHAVSQPTLQDALQGLKACQEFQISPRVLLKIAQQFVAQKINPLNKWKLAALFDEFQAEIFTTILKKTNYSFYTLFLNAIAHYQHHYWRQFDRTLFNPEIKCPDCKETDDPLLFGYLIYDRILGNILKLIDPQRDTILILSGLSQVPYLKKEGEGGMNYYRLKDHKKFVAELGLSPEKVFPMMSRDWQIHFTDAQEEKLIRETLENIRIAESPLFQISQNSPHSLFIETAVTKFISPLAELHAPGKTLGQFGAHFVNTAVKSGHHIGEGSLWISKKLDFLSAAPEKIPLTQVAQIPLILNS